MALTIDATVGGANSNSYVTLLEANNYFEARLYSDTWNNAQDDVKNRALVMATRRIGQETFYGDRATDTQKLPFPRINIGRLDGVELDNTIPDILKEAQFELAIHLLTVDMSKPSVDTSNIKSVKVGSLAVDYAIDQNDNVSQSFDSLPPFVTSLLANLSRTVATGGSFYIGR